MPSRSKQLNRSSGLRRLMPFAAIAVLVLSVSCIAYASTSHSSSKHRRATRSFVVRGNVSTPLQPGDEHALNLRITNRRNFPIWVTALVTTIKIDAAHKQAGCSATRDFSVSQLARATFPIRLGARRSYPRRRTSHASRLIPMVKMLNLENVNQDNCKGAVLTLHYFGRSVNKRPHRGLTINQKKVKS
jgi:hypothetical protein